MQSYSCGAAFRNNTSKMTKVHISKVVEMDNIRANLPLPLNPHQQTRSVVRCGSLMNGAVCQNRLLSLGTVSHRVAELPPALAAATKPFLLFAQA